MRNYFWNLLGFVLLAFIAFCVVWVCLGVWKSIKPPVVKDRIASNYIKERMKFHGIQVATCEGDVCTFQRNGKKVKL